MQSNMTQEDGIKGIPYRAAAAPGGEGRGGAPSLSSSSSSFPLLRGDGHQYVLLELLRSERRLQRRLQEQREALHRLQEGLVQLFLLSKAWEQAEHEGGEQEVEEEGEGTGEGRRGVKMSPMAYHTLHELLLRTFPPDDDDAGRDSDSPRLRKRAERLLYLRLIDSAGLPPSHALLYGSVTLETLPCLFMHLQRWVSALGAKLPSCCEYVAASEDRDGNNASRVMSTVSLPPQGEDSAPSHPDTITTVTIPTTAVEATVDTYAAGVYACLARGQQLQLLCCAMKRLLEYLQLSTQSQSTEKREDMMELVSPVLLLPQLLQASPEWRGKLRFLLVDVEEVRDTLAEEVKYRRQVGLIHRPAAVPMTEKGNGKNTAESHEGGDAAVVVAPVVQDTLRELCGAVGEGSKTIATTTAAAATFISGPILVQDAGCPYVPPGAPDAEWMSIAELAHMNELACCVCKQIRAGLST